MTALAFQRKQQSRRIARVSLDDADALMCCVTEIKEQCALWAASPRFMNDDAQQMLADIQDNILPGYALMAQRQAEDASEVL